MRLPQVFNFEEQFIAFSFCCALVSRLSIQCQIQGDEDFAPMFSSNRSIKEC